MFSSLLDYKLNFCLESNRFSHCRALLLEDLWIFFRLCYILSTAVSYWVSLLFLSALLYIIIINEFHQDASLKENFRAAVQVLLMLSMLSLISRRTLYYVIFCCWENSVQPSHCKDCGCCSTCRHFGTVSEHLRLCYNWPTLTSSFMAFLNCIWHTSSLSENWSHASATGRQTNRLAKCSIRL